MFYMKSKIFFIVLICLSFLRCLPVYCVSNSETVCGKLQQTDKRNENDIYDFENDDEDEETDNEENSINNTEKKLNEQISKNIFWEDKFYIEQKVNYPESIKINTGINAIAYSCFINFQLFSKEEKYKPKIYSAGLMFTPLFTKNAKNKKFNKALSFYAGGIKKPAVFSRFERPVFSKIKPSHNFVPFPIANLLRLSASQKKLGYAAEFSLPFFNFLFLYMPDKTETGGDFKIHTSFSKIDFKNPLTKLNISFISEFFPKATTKKTAKTEKRYIQLYGTEIIFKSEFFSFDMLGSLEHIPPQKISGAFRSEFLFSYNFFKLDTGFSYREKNYIGSQTGKQKEQFTVFVQPLFLFSFMKFSCSYLFSKVYYSEDKLNSFGADISVIHKNIIYINKLFYSHNIYDFYTELKLKDFVKWFSFARIYGGLHFQSKKINPFCVKKYYAVSEIRFCISNNIRLGIESGFSQKNAVIKRRKKASIIKWQNPEYFGSTYIYFSIKNKKAKHSGALYAKVKNISPVFTITVSYKLSF